MFLVFDFTHNLRRLIVNVRSIIFAVFLISFLTRMGFPVVFKHLFDFFYKLLVLALFWIVRRSPSIALPVHVLVELRVLHHRWFLVGGLNPVFAGCSLDATRVKVFKLFVSWLCHFVVPLKVLDLQILHILLQIYQVLINRLVIKEMLRFYCFWGRRV